MTKPNPFRYFKTSLDTIRPAVMLYVRFPLPLRNVEDLLHERGIEISQKTVLFWWNRFDPLFAAEIRRKRINRMRSYSNWQWHLDEVFVKVNGETHYLWRAVDHEGEVPETFVTKRRDRKATSKFLRKLMKCYGSPKVIVTDRLRSYGAAMRVIGNAEKQETGRWKNNRRRIHICLFDEEKGRCCGSAECEVYRNSLPSILQFTTALIRNAASQNEIISSSTAPQLSPSGANFVPCKVTHYAVN